MKMATHLLMKTTKSIKEIAKEVGMKAKVNFLKLLRNIMMFYQQSIEYSIQTN